MLKKMNNNNKLRGVKKKNYMESICCVFAYAPIAQHPISLPLPRQSTIDGVTALGVTEGVQGWLRPRKLQAGDSIGSAINLSKIIGSVCKVIEVSRHGSGRCGDR